MAKRESSQNQTLPPEKLDTQAVDRQRGLPFQFLTSLLRFGSDWFANHALKQRMVASHRGCNRRATWPPSLGR